MKHYFVTFKTMAPLLLGDRPRDQHMTSNDYVPGSALLGGLAYAYLREKRLTTDAIDAGFESFFLKDRIWFGDLYPATFKPFITSEKPVKPLPHTARSCKRWPGFTYKGKEHEDDEERHGVVDHLIVWSLFEASHQQNTAVVYANRNCAYKHCGQQLDRFDGFYRMYRPEISGKAQLHTRLVTGTGINRLTGTVQEQILFSKEVIAAVTPRGEGQLFQGRLTLDDALEDDFFDFLEQESLQLRVGRAKTRGFGKLQLTDYSEQQPETLDAFRERLTQFDALVKDQARDYQILADNPQESGIHPEYFYFSITCCADLILRGANLRYRTSLTADYVQQELLNTVHGIKILYQNASVYRITGWNNLWRLPKTAEPAIGKGSAFLIEYQGTPDETFWNRLHQGQYDGIGTRKAEGFGWISISDDFHREVTQR